MSAQPSTVLRTPVLGDGTVTLRAWQPDDVPALEAAYRDPELQRRVPVKRPFNPADVSDFALRIAGEAWSSGRGAPFAVVDATTGELLASVVVRNWDHMPGTGEVGYWVAAHARGRGVALASMRLLCRWAFDDLGLNRIVFEIDSDNAASRAVAQRLGASEMDAFSVTEWDPDGDLGDGIVVYRLAPGALTA